MKPLLYLRTLGRFELVRLDLGKPVPVPAGKSRALLVYLALTPHQVRREYLADLIWPDLPVEAGRFNLRHTLFHLRRLCNPVCGMVDLFVHDRDHVSLTPGMLEVDISLLFSPGAHHDEAVLCQDDFVADMHLPGCDEFEEWLVSTHERIQLAQVEILETLSSNCAATGDMDAAIAHARRLIHIMPYSDEARQRLMRLLGAEGRRQAVMAELECFSALLMRDLGVSPKVETLRLAEEVGVKAQAQPVPAVARAERRLAPRRERRSVTVLYCELANSLAADASLSSMTEAEELFAAVMGKYEGTVLRSLRWGMLAYFGYPMAWEDAPACAVSAALAASDAFTAAEMPVRSGLHLGLMVADAHFPDLTGELAEIAHRISLVAESGEVMISGELQGVIASRFATESLGEKHFRGLGRSLQVARVATSMVPSKVENAPPQLFGREREVILLEKGLARVRAGETLHLSVYGAEGMGKSALAKVAAVKASELGMRVMKLRFPPECHYNPYYPISFDLIEYFGFDEECAGKANPLAQASMEQAADSDQAAFASLFRSLASDSDDVETPSSPRQERLIAGLAELMQERCKLQPILLIAEDMHRADSSTCDLLAYLVSRVQSRLMILSTSLDVPVPGADMEGEHIRLAPLERMQAQALVRSVAKDEIVNDASMARIVDLAAGLPFFLIEMARGNGKNASPSCAQALLQVRLDRLGVHKRVAQMASVLGHCVEPESLSKFCDLPMDKLGESLRILHAAAILQWDDDGRLVFQNASLCEAVYLSLMEEDRRQAHRRAAQLLSAEAANRALVAHHFDMTHE